LDVDVEGGLVGEEVVGDVGLGLLVLEQVGACIRERGWQTLYILCGRVYGSVLVHSAL
jgi:hypothetical protein